jgi:hypothetical protein
MVFLNFKRATKQSPAHGGWYFSHAGFGIALVRQLYVDNRAVPCRFRELQMHAVNDNSTYCVANTLGSPALLRSGVN